MSFNTLGVCERKDPQAGGLGRDQRGPGGVRPWVTIPSLIARNPEEDSKLPYLLHLPMEGGLVLKARATWPRSARIYCHPYEAHWPDDAEVVEETPVSSCRRRGPVIDLVLDRPRLSRSQFVFTQTRGHPPVGPIRRSREALASAAIGVPAGNSLAS
jgi:hypothetical protein